MSVLFAPLPVDLTREGGGGKEERGLCHKCLHKSNNDGCVCLSFNSKVYIIS